MATLSEMLVKLGVDTSDYQSGIDKAITANKTAKESVSELSESVKAFMDGIDSDAVEKFGAGLNADAGRAQALKDEVAKANAALDEFFGAGKSRPPVIPPETIPQVMNLEQAFGRLGVTSSASLKESADSARVAYETIKNSGIASARDIQQAWIAMEEARQKAAIQAGEQITAADRKALADAKRAIDQHTQDIAASFREMGDKLRNVGNDFMRAGASITALTAPLVGIGVVSLKMAADFELGMRKVTSLMGTVAEEDFRKLSDETLNLSKRLGVDAVKATEALYEAISAGVPKENAIQFLEVASVAAIAGVTSTKTAVDSLTTVLNAYHLESSKAKEVSDAMFMAVNLGKFNFEQLAASMGKTSGFAAQLGVSFQEVLGAATTISKQGFTVSQAMTQIQSAMKAIIAPNQEMNALLEKTGFESGQAMLKALGFEASLQKVREAAGGSVEEMTRGLGRIEGFKGLLALTGENAKAAAQDLREIIHASDGLGAATLAYNEINKSAARQWEILKTQIKDSAIELGTALLPSARQAVDALTPLIHGVQGLASGFAGLPDGLQKTSIGLIAAGVAAGGATIAFGALMRGAGDITRLVGDIVKFASESSVLASVLKALSVEGLGFAGTLGVSGVALAGFGAAVIATISNLNELRERHQEIVERLKADSIAQALASGRTVDELAKASGGMDQLKASLMGVDDQVKLSISPLGELTAKITKAGDAAKEFAKDWKDTGLQINIISSDITKTSAEAVSKTARDLIESQAKAEERVKSLRGALEQLRAKYGDSAEGAGILARAQAKLDEAIAATEVRTKAHSGSLGALVAEQSKLEAAAEHAQLVFVEAARKYGMASDIAEKALKQMREANEKAFGEVEGMNDFEKSLQDLIEAQKTAEEHARTMGAVYLTLQAQSDGTASAIQLVAAAWKKFSEAAVTAGTTANTLLGTLKSYTSEIPILVGGIQQAADAGAKLTRATVDTTLSFGRMLSSLPPIAQEVVNIATAWERMNGFITADTSTIQGQAYQVDILSGHVKGVQQSWDMVDDSVRAAGSAVDDFIAKTANASQELNDLFVQNLANAHAMIAAMSNMSFGPFPTNRTFRWEELAMPGPGHGGELNPLQGAFRDMMNIAMGFVATLQGWGKFAPGSGSVFAPDKAWSKNDVDQAVRDLDNIQSNTSQLVTTLPDALGKALSGTQDELIKFIQSELSGGASMEDIQRELMARGIEAELDADGMLHVMRSVADNTASVVEATQRAASGIGDIALSSQEILAETIKSGEIVAHGIGALADALQTPEEKANAERTRLPSLVSSIGPAILPLGSTSLPRVTAPFPNVPAVQYIPPGVVASGTTVNLVINGSVYQQSLIDQVMSELRSVGLRPR